MSINSVVYLLFMLRNQIKIYHWQTKYYSRHKASDELVEKLDETMDKFVETYQGIYENIKIENDFNIVLNNVDDTEIIQFIRNIRSILIEETNKFVATELLNIRDEILHVIDKALYLFRLQ